ncbi:MAG: anti-phage defense ZorAB system ZorA [Desulfobacterium sp.]|nr:anti-phage defense ZorAB system ZorA [Desulfobacterium sp.]
MNNVQDSFSLSKLWPDFVSIFDGRLTTNNGLSAIIVALLYFVFLYSIGYVIWNWIKSKKQINFLKKLIKGLTPDDLSKKRRDLRLSAKKDVKTGELWGEFDETLITSADGEKLYNTLDASYFFNTSTLASAITENRLLAAVPGFLTAIGVIGTFAGLQLGLGGLELGKDVGIDVLRDGIGHLINGASIAFLTSVWGVITSLLFNVAEKFSERIIRKEINALQDEIDNLYPRANAEEALVKICDYSKGSSEVLKTLAEKIGNQMQEALIKVSDNIQGGLDDSLNRIMAPAIQTLVANSNEGAQTAMDSLLSRFMEKMGEQGTNQREMMVDASSKMNDTMGALGDKMNVFLEKLEHQQDELQQTEKQNAEDIQTTISDVTRQSREAIEFAVETAKTSTDQLAEGLSAKIDNQEKRDQDRNEFFRKQFSEMQSGSETLMAQLNLLIKNQKEVSGTLLGQSQNLLRDMERVTLANKEATGKMHDTSRELGGVAVELKAFGATMDVASKGLGNSITVAMDRAGKLTEDNYKATNRVEQLANSVGEIKSGVVNVTDKLAAITEKADASFVNMKDHQNAFQAALNDHVENLEAQLTKILSDYGDRVNGQTIERLNVWNKHTSEYTRTMTDAISSLAGVVDEIETKVSAS